MKTAIVTNIFLFDHRSLKQNFSLMVPLVASDEAGASNSPTSSSPFYQDGRCANQDALSTTCNNIIIYTYE